MNKTLINSINKFKILNKSSNSFDLNGFSKYVINGKGTCLVDAEGRYFVIKKKK